MNWMNLPPISYEEIFQSPRSEYVIEFQEQICCYHEADSIQDKIEIMQSLLQLTEDWSLNEKNPLFPIVKTRLEAKLKYLMDLQSALQTDWVSYHLASDPKMEYVPLQMRNNLTYSLKMGEFWGAFWLESIDPCHRRLGSYYQKYIDETGNPDDWNAFFLWLEKEQVPKNIPIVRYFTNEEAQKYRFVFEEGLCVDPLSKCPLTLTAKGKQALFVISLDKELYISHEGDGVWHSSFTRGRPVLAAGRIEVEKGVITALGFDSGHYLPQEDSFFQFIQLFKDLKATFQNPLKIIYYENRCKYSAMIPTKLLENEVLFKSGLSQNQQLISICEF